MSRPTTRVNVYDLAVLLMNTWLCATDPFSGLHDAEVHPSIFMARMRHSVEVEDADLERLAYAAQMLHERGKFWHPEQKDWPAYQRAALPGHEYDAVNCVLTRKETKA